MQARYLVMIPAVLCSASGAWAASGVERTLTAAPAVPAGDRVQIENLTGHMTVSQGPSFKVTATVMAGGDQAETLAETVKLDVITSGKQVTVHVHYPVNEYSTYLYNPQLAGGNGDDNNCFLGVFCFRFNDHSDVNYQDADVEVHENGVAGTPLYVNVAIQLPTGVGSELINAVGRVDAQNLANALTINTHGSDIYVANLTGSLNANSRSGDVHVQGLNGNLKADTSSGDLTVHQLNGDVNIITGSGDLRISNAVTHTLYADTGSGDATLKRVQGDMTLDTDSGDADLDEISGSLHIDTGSGELIATHYIAGSNLWVNTGSGDAHISGDLSAVRKLDIDTGSGDAVLRTTAALEMHLEVYGDGGDVNINLPDITNFVSRNHYFSGDIGKAVGQGTIHSGGGDVTLSQE